jgi:PEP-CTERM motif-containing protein
MQGSYLGTSMKNNLLSLSTLTILAGLLFCTPAANAAFDPIPLPDSTYTSSTTLIPITGPDGDTILTLSDANLTVTFSTAMQKFTVPDSWTNWNSPPATETSTPRVLSPADFTLTSITLSFSQPLTTFGLEAEPDATTQGAFPVTLDFFNGLTLLGTVTRTIDGSGAALFAAGSTTPITSVTLTVGGNANVPEGVDPGIAQIRYTAAVPEPSTWILFAAGLGLLTVRRYRFTGLSRDLTEVCSRRFNKDLSRRAYVDVKSGAL